MKMLTLSTTRQSLLVSCDRVRKETQRDSILLQVLDIVLQGTWDFHTGNEFKPYINGRNKLAVHAPKLCTLGKQSLFLQHYEEKF